MTDNDNLRDRIAEVLDRAYNEHDRNHWGAAQEIIDEFELTTETHAATHAKRNMTRITGAWEWDNQ